MMKKNISSDYVVIASLLEDEKMNVLVAFKGENTLDNLYLLNEFAHNKSNLYFFKKLFSSFSSPKHPGEFVDFFVDNDRFYAVFKYFEAAGITHRYKKGLSTAHFDERCKILENILVKIDSAFKTVPELAGCVSEPENILVDNERNIYINYNLKNIAEYKGVKLETIFKNIRDVIFTILQPEVEARFNKQLHIVVDKCKRGVYSSIPELIIELRKAEKISKASSWISYIKYLIELRRPIINKITQGAVTSALVAGLIYLGYTKLTQGQSTGSAPATVTIGNITYTPGSDDESPKNVSIENEDNQTAEKPTSDITLSKGLDMEYEDYIIQHGDTVSSICESYYKDLKFITAVATFNGIEPDSKLTAGTILKLPNRTAIALYISK